MRPDEQVDIEGPPGTKYGLLDTEDGCWFGDTAGVKLLDEFWLARIAAQVIDKRLGNEPGRTRARPFIDRPLRHKDTLDTKMDTLEALKKLEDGL